MNPLERSLIEKARYANGWENVRVSTPEQTVLFSARHKAEAHVMPPLTQGGPWQVTFPNGPPATELGTAILSKCLTVAQCALLGLTGGDSLRLRWVSPAHLPYLAWHRGHLFQP